MIGCTYQVLLGDALTRLREMPDESVHAWITSPPYWALRDYGVAGQLGLEATPEEYIERMVEVFREARRVLRRDGVLFLNLGDCYANDAKWGGATGGKHAKALHGDTGIGRRRKTSGLKPKELVGMPWRIALALQADGWWLRTDLVWHKPNVQPEAVEDRPTRDHEYIFMLTRAEHYFCDMEAVRQPVTGGAHPRGSGLHKKARQEELVGGTRQNASISEAITGLVTARNLRTVWSIQTAANGAAEHFATYPEELPALCIRMATSEVGCCRACGAPVRRLLEKVRLKDGRPVEDLPAMRDQSLERPDSGQGFGHWRITTERRTIGWGFGCGCFAGAPVPCTVGDFFSGTATTGAAALKLGRNYRGIELNPKYQKLSLRRLAATAPLFARELV